jgi:hypothetical protein
MAENQDQAQQPEKKKLKISEVKELLKAGKDRKAIGEYYGLRPSEVTALFQHPKLKGLRVRPAPSFVLEDDEEEAQAEASVSQDAPTSQATNTAGTAKKAKKPAVAQPEVEDDEAEGQEGLASNTITKGEAIKEVQTEDDRVEEATKSTPKKPDQSSGVW